MTSEASTEKALPASPTVVDEEVEEKTIGGKATPDEIYLIDRACLELRIKRGPFIVEAAIERARTVLAAKSTLETRAV